MWWRLEAARGALDSSGGLVGLRMKGGMWWELGSGREVLEGEAAGEWDVMDVSRMN